LLGSRDEVACQETDLRANRPRQAIDDDWVFARHTMENLRIMLGDPKLSVNFLTDPADGLAGSNRRVTGEQSSAEETLERLRKFLPGAPHVAPSKKTDGFSRADLTSLEIQSHTAAVILLSLRIKTQALKTAAETLSARAAELAAIITDHEQSPEQASIERENADKAFDKAAELRAEFISRRRFAEQEAKLLEERVQQREDGVQDIARTADQATEELGRRRWRSNSTRRYRISRQ
jgi:hypothetical protein